MLRVVLGWSDRDAARAMDCSRNALEGHLKALGDRFDGEDAQALRHGMAAIDAEHRSRMVDSGVWRLRKPWRWMILGVVLLLLLDLLVRVLEAGRY